MPNIHKLKEERLIWLVVSEGSVPGQLAARQQGAAEGLTDNRAHLMTFRAQGEEGGAETETLLPLTARTLQTNTGPVGFHLPQSLANEIATSISNCRSASQICPHFQAHRTTLFPVQ